jgi:hypothetical protein
MKIDKPHKIAICLNAPTLERANQQKEALNGIQDLFEIEWDLRSERFTGDYISFSQMINEAVLCTESEFMIFINPKAKVQKEDIIKIIDSLCNGYCLSNIMAFGLWGTTKQLFREIGMFDERLIGSEYEDDDFLLRTILHNKAIDWNHERHRYDDKIRTPMVQNDYRGMSGNIFREKWNIDKDLKNIHKSKYYAEEKRMPIFLNKNNSIISNSWNDFNTSKHDNDGIFKNYIGYTIIETLAEVEHIMVDFTIVIDDHQSDPNKRILALFSENEVNATIAISQVIDTNKKILALPRFTYSKNTQYPFDKDKLIDNMCYNITIWHRNRSIYNNNFIYSTRFYFSQKFNLADLVFKK